MRQLRPHYIDQISVKSLLTTAALSTFIWNQRNRGTLAVTATQLHQEK